MAVATMERVALSLAMVSTSALAGEVCTQQGGPGCQMVGAQLLQVKSSNRETTTKLTEDEMTDCEDTFKLMCEDSPDCTKAFVQKNCKKSCGLCSEATAAPAPAAGGESEACEDEYKMMCADSPDCTKRFAQDKCKKTCGTCSATPSSTPEPAPRPAPRPSTTAAPSGGTPSPAPVSPVTSKPTTPTPITSENMGRCYKDEASQPANVKWYTWWIGDEQRCTSVYIPPDSVASKPMPVMLKMNCYGKDAKAAEEFGRFPVANFLLSTNFEDRGGSGGWRTGNDGIVSDENPQPCSDADTPEIAYLKAIFQIIEDDPATFDASKIYTYGFSQNSVFSAYVGFCFSHKVAGIVQGGSGMVVTADGGRAPPNQGGYCPYSEYNEVGPGCARSKPCADCQYWPIYPCYEPKPVVYCGFIYENDYMKHTMQPMYDRAVAEGFDARMTTVPGGSHLELKNKEEWYAGCLGITAACSATCAADVSACVQSSTYDSDRAYSDCTSKDMPASCAAGCAPTQEMLVLSETPSSMQMSTGAFGAPHAEKSRPSGSKCEHAV